MTYITHIPRGAHQSAAALALLIVVPYTMADTPRIEFTNEGIAAIHERFSGFSEALPSTHLLGVDRIVAYEENEHFTYAQGKAGERLTRRFALLKPGILAVDDIDSGGHTDRSLRVFRQSAGEWTVESVDAAGDVVNLELSASDRVFDLQLPAAPADPGSIAVARSDGQEVLPRRLLPSGVMPHGENGAKLLQRWDAAYRRKKLPGWDVGRPASELVQTIQAGTIKPGRALVLGCGTGTSAIYLAGKGFDVTAVDVAPTALTLAKAKADKAGVSVRWLVADVVALPELEPFDFIFDRGCYHHVRRYDAKGFVSNVRRLTREGSFFLLLAGNANETRHYGPPRVKETELVTDLAADFAFQELREMRFEGRDPNRKSGPMAWYALLRRRAD